MYKYIYLDKTLIKISTEYLLNDKINSINSRLLL